MKIYSIDLGKKKLEGENLEPNPRKRWLEGANQNVHPQVMCGGDIKRLLNVIFH